MVNDAASVSYEPSYFLHLQPDGAMLVERNSMYYFRLSGTAAQLALLLAKTKSVEKTAKVWSNINGIPFSTEQLVHELNQHPLTESWMQGALGTLRLTGSTKSYLPISCTLQLTNGCNLFCSFCYASSGKPLEQELAVEDWMEILQKLSASGVSDITLTGGEARLAKGFKRIVTTASTLFTNVHLFSNGLYWKEDEIELISALGNIFVQVSVDGSAHKHDKLRGKKGAYIESMRNIKRLAERGIPCLIAMTVNPQNYEDISAVIQDAALAGAAAFRAGVTLPVGRADNHYFELDNEQYLYVDEKLKEAVRNWGDRLLITDWGNEGNDGCNDFCTPGYLAWYIRADGEVTPCQIEGASMGHILKDSLDDIGTPERLLRARENATSCKCIGKVELPKEADLPFV
ncbi:sporulation killing factor system radical SAM maturase [Paenibacillus algorifonticola]|uniref:sporulation killing factor system radical SAM maturase n=1 Tax=Paenibacillus algorifonticola TaxID=684063 RepID=UPI003D29B70F